MTLTHSPPSSPLSQVSATAQWLEAVLQKPENAYCCDCGAANPRWVSINLGVFLCLRCSGVHRSLGTHISRIRSVDLDAWTLQEIATLDTQGNKVGNQIWEAVVPLHKTKPTPSSPISELEAWIKAKYCLKAFALQLSSTQLSKEMSSNAASRRRSLILPSTRFDAEQSQSEASSSADESPMSGDEEDLEDIRSSIKGEQLRFHLTQRRMRAQSVQLSASPPSEGFTVGSPPSSVSSSRVKSVQLSGSAPLADGLRPRSPPSSIASPRKSSPRPFRKSHSLDKNIHQTLNLARLRKAISATDETDLWEHLEQESGITEEQRRGQIEERKRMLAEAKQRKKEKKEAMKKLRKELKEKKKEWRNSSPMPQVSDGESQVPSRAMRDRHNEERRILLEQLAADIKDRKEEDLFLKRSEIERQQKRSADLARIRERMKEKELTAKEAEGAHPHDTNTNEENHGCMEDVSLKQS